MKIDEFKLILYDKFDEILLPKDYKFVKSNHGYKSKTENWSTEIKFICTKFSSGSFSITPNISISNISWSNQIKKITENKYYLSIWGEIPLIDKWLYNKTKSKEESTFWLDDDNLDFVLMELEKNLHQIILPFFDKIMNEKDFAFDILSKYPNCFYCLDRLIFYPIVWRETGNNIADLKEIINNQEYKNKESLKIIEKNNGNKFKIWREDFEKVKKDVIK